ncbi:MAG: Gfo/Idh/MocA family oxidoreductase [Spirochaetaceae bacterium]
MSDKLQAKIAVVGLGNMGTSHLKSLTDTKNTKLVAVCDINKYKADKFAKEYGVEVFYNHKDLLNWGEFDGIIIATPHYDHTVIAIDAFEKGFHVLTEKPVGVHSNDIKKMVKAWEEAKQKNPSVLFAAMFQQRTLEQFKKIKDLIDSGELGKLVRTSWIITDWFRTQNYYDKGGWRATWKGEGGGVLLNQCPHQLDLYQWFVGMPDRVTGFMSIGKYHDIEVEDEVTGYFQYNNGMVGHFITSTGESPGTNRLEIVGEMGKIVFENDELTFFRNRKSMLTHLKEAKSGFSKVENWEIKIPCPKNEASAHRIIIENFADAILDGKSLIAPATEGINSVSLGNAIMLSQFEGNTIDMPIDGDVFEKKLMDLINSSTFEKKKVEDTTEVADMSASF